MSETLKLIVCVAIASFIGCFWMTYKASGDMDFSLVIGAIGAGGGIFLIGVTEIFRPRAARPRRTRQVCGRH